MPFESLSIVGIAATAAVSRTQEYRSQRLIEGELAPFRLKCLKPEFVTDGQALKSFFAEAELLSQRRYACYRMPYVGTG